MTSRSAVSLVLDLARLQAVGLHLPADQIAAGDLKLLVSGVARQADDLHTIAQRPRDGGRACSRSHESDAAEIERNCQIVVPEGVVLLGIEHLQQRRAGISVDAGAELVDLVQHHDAIARAGLADRLDDVAGQRADIGAPVAADLRFVMHAAQADTHEFPAHGAGDRLAERGLADAGRPDEAQDRRFCSAARVCGPRDIRRCAA